MSLWQTLLSDFHFLRPWWLAATLPAIALAVLLWRHKRQAQNWQSVIAPELLPFLLDGASVKPNPRYLVVLAAAWIIASLALAGPTWEKRPVAVEKNQQALVLVLDLSPSMLSEDLRPSRLVRARLKIADILRQHNDGQTALIVYAGDAHSVVPLTDDTQTISNLLSTLSPNIMPIDGSNTEAAIDSAIQMLDSAETGRGDILLITDGVEDSAIDKINDRLAAKPQYRLSVLGVGGLHPTPIPAGRGGFLRDAHNNIVTTLLQPSSLERLASSNRGRYHTITPGDADIRYLVSLPQPEKQETHKVDRDFDNWYDQGHWLVLLLLPVLLYCFRRGVLLLLFCLPLMQPKSAYAFGWSDLWSNQNQQAYKHFAQQQHQQAAEQFTDPDWKAAAEYRAGHYDKAAELYAQNQTANADFNRGNALAKAGKLEDAVKAYDQALQKDASLEDAKKNRALVKKLLEQQKQNQQQKDSDKNQDQKNQDQKNQDQKNQDKKDQDKKSQDQQDQNQKSKDQQNQDQKNQDQQNQNQKDQDKQNQQDQQNQSGQNSSQQHSAQQQNQQNQQGEQGQSSSASDLSQSGNQSSAGSAASAQAQQTQAQSSAAASEGSSAAAQAVQTIPEDNLTPEQRQAMEQWLRRVPDEPGNLLRNKFSMEYQRHRRDQRNGDYEPPENDADKRY